MRSIGGRWLSVLPCLVFTACTAKGAETEKGGTEAAAPQAAARPVQGKLDRAAALNILKAKMPPRAISRCTIPLSCTVMTARTAFGPYANTAEEQRCRQFLDALEKVGLLRALPPVQFKLTTWAGTMFMYQLAHPRADVAITADGDGRGGQRATFDGLILSVDPGRGVSGVRGGDAGDETATVRYWRSWQRTDFLSGIMVATKGLEAATLLDCQGARQKPDDPVPGGGIGDGISEGSEEAEVLLTKWDDGWRVEN